ncbi:MAG: hydantoinase/oxoprolinase family protein [Clostridia bacterium]|nr:hydantoinase/oxoprolinase family protein [Clostridia bacterium]
MMIGIGIDTGGTCTDAVIYDFETRKVLAAGKALTTKENLEIGIANALDQLPEALLKQAESLALSTTLATNACVENKGCRAKLLVIGTSPDIIASLRKELSDHGISDMSQLIVLDARPENLFSNPYDPDWEALEESIPELFSDCDSVGIVQAYPNANGGRFEFTALRILKKHLTIPLTIAYDICKEISFMRICASTLLNARLIPLISEFLRAVHRVMARRGLDIPILIVRSDGVLMSEEMALTRPVETLLCGPAASVVGGLELSKADDAIVLDMGGTTTDIAMVRRRNPIMTGDGVMIGQYRTSVRGVDARAVSLGGDTAVRYDSDGLYLDTVRIIPVSVLADAYPCVVGELKKLAASDRQHTRMSHEFYVLQRDIFGKAGFTAEEQALCGALKDGPVITNKLAGKLGLDVYQLNTKRLEQEGVVIKSGITPTDMMVLKGDLALYDPTAAEEALKYVAKSTHIPAEQIPDRVYEMVVKAMYKHLGGFLLHQQYPGQKSRFAPEHTEALLEALYEQAKGHGGGIAGLSLKTPLPLVGIGAPIHVFLPEVARLFGTRAILNEYSGVANALGAACSQRVTRLDVNVFVNSTDAKGGYYVMADCRKHLFRDLEDAVAFGRKTAEAEIREKAALQGIGEDMEIELTVEHDIFDNKVYLGCVVHAEARPFEDSDARRIHNEEDNA